jgi:dihydrofolate reductase
VGLRPRSLAREPGPPRRQDYHRQRNRKGGVHPHRSLRDGPPDVRRGGGGLAGPPPFGAPVFVLTHHGREPWIRQGGTTFAFVTDGIESALEQARAAAGNKDVRIAGGADTVQQFLEARLVDEVQIHLAPVLLGGGVRLFERIDSEHVELEKTRVIDSPRVTHLAYRIVKERTQ